MCNRVCTNQSQRQLGVAGASHQLLKAGPARATGVMLLLYGAAGPGKVLGGLMPQGTNRKLCRSTQRDTASSRSPLLLGAMQQPG